MGSRRAERVTGELIAETRVRLWWSALGKLAAEEAKAENPEMGLLERARLVEDRLQLAMAARGEVGRVDAKSEPPKKGKAARARMAKYKFVG